MGTAVKLFLLALLQLAIAQDYCSVCRDHTMCKYVGRGSACNGNTKGGVSPSEAREILNVHNAYRAKVAKGQENRGRPGPQPPAANMQTLVWDTKLAEVAQRWADQCVFQHDRCRNDPRFEVGQNIYWSSGYSEVNWTRAVDSWYEEVSQFNRHGAKNFSPNPRIGHYTQMVWGNTKFMGCGRTTYGRGYKVRDHHPRELVLSASPTDKINDTASDKSSSNRTSRQANIGFFGGTSFDSAGAQGSITRPSAGESGGSQPADTPNGNGPGTGNAPNHLGTGNGPNYPGTGNRPNYPGTGNRPNYPSTGSRPNYPGTENRPNYPGTGNRPNYPDTVNHPNYLGAESHPNYLGTESHPIFPGTGNRPSFPGSGFLQNFPGLANLPFSGGPINPSLYGNTDNFPNHPSYAIFLNMGNRPNRPNYAGNGLNYWSQSNFGANYGYYAGTSGHYPVNPNQYPIHIPAAFAPSASHYTGHEVSMGIPENFRLFDEEEESALSAEPIHQSPQEGHLPTYSEWQQAQLYNEIEPCIDSENPVSSYGWFDNFSPPNNDGLSTNQILICNYGPSGNYQNEPVYLEGDACSRCPTGITCKDGLCGTY